MTKKRRYLELYSDHLKKGGVVKIYNSPTLKLKKKENRELKINFFYHEVTDKKISFHSLFFCLTSCFL